jgi:hypothetical protein
MRLENNEEFVIWYLNKLYLCKGKKIYYKFLINEESLTLYQLKENIHYSLGFNDIKTTDKLINNWYQTIINSFKGDILDYLKFKYKVILGSNSWWIVNFKGVKTPINDIKLELIKKYDNGFLDEIIDEWFDNEVVKISESLMFKFD